MRAVGGRAAVGGATGFMAARAARAGPDPERTCRPRAEEPAAAAAAAAGGEG